MLFVRLDSYVFGGEKGISDDPDWKEYTEKYSQLSRSELMKADSNLYRRLSKKDILKNIPRKKPSDEKHFKILESRVYDGVVKGEIRNKDFAHYLWLWRNGLLELSHSKLVAYQNL